MVRTKCETYSRVCGYLRPIDKWNEGKLEEYKDKKLFKVFDNNNNKDIKDQHNEI